MHTTLLPLLFGCPSLLNVDLIYEWTPQAIDAYVDELEKNYSTLARAYDVGASHGRRMKALEVSADVGRGSHMKPGIRIMAGFRGRESVGSQVGECV